LKDTIIFIEENNAFVFSEEFADFVKKSGNYFVLISRRPLKMLPYSVHEIYEIVTDSKRTDIKESYHELRELYSNYPFLENNKMQNIITEDSNSGYQFFKKAFEQQNVVSANGNGNIIKKVEELKNGDVLVVVDGAAFGAMIEDCLESFETKNDCRIALWWPESFELLILKSGIIKSEQLTRILNNTSDYVECKEYESWERFFTELLVFLTKDTPYKYSKHLLNEYFLQEKNMDKIISQFPDSIKDVIFEA
jgi:hypothetical protein